eukprot:CAMPEP_0117583318 /NCGR_PEP_ID=MMETSP0784-20121206/66946_1 /TAXON_ID=39447 /ORGANISM="" /LENGTH=192 /DNA_ID=CAMNT_0005383987 /DNA_START=242 /DNA_END=817 /DNA_ORIENTATION=+
MLLLDLDVQEFVSGEVRPVTDPQVEPITHVLAIRGASGFGRSAKMWIPRNYGLQQDEKRAEKDRGRPCVHETEEVQNAADREAESAEHPADQAYEEFPRPVISLGEGIASVQFGRRVAHKFRSKGLGRRAVASQVAVPIDESLRTRKGELRETANAVTNFMYNRMTRPASSAPSSIHGQRGWSMACMQSLAR